VRSPEFEPGSSAWQDDNGATGRRRSLNWARSKLEFTEYMRAKSYNQRYVKCIISYLGRFLVELREPMDVVRMFSGLTSGQRHNLNRAVRNFLNFHELKGVNADYLNSLRKAIPKEVATFDLNVPSEEEIQASLRKLEGAPLKYRCLWNLLLDSGLRLTEAVRLINDFDDAIKVNGFYRCTLGYFRGSKLAFAGYFTPYTLKLIQNNQEELDDRTASHYYSKLGYVAPKYLRKFAFDTMISEDLSIPESVADFIGERVPKKVGARHYTKSLRHRLHKKVKLLRDELRMLEEAGFAVVKNSSQVVKNSYLGEGANRDPIQNRGAFVVRSPGFEPGIASLEDSTKRNRLEGVLPLDAQRPHD
jgi:intergrase/recombinase